MKHRGGAALTIYVSTLGLMLWGGFVKISRPFWKTSAYLPDLLPFMGQFRKAGLRVWIFTQTMAQLASDELYGQTGFKAIFGLCSIKQFFSIREPEVAQLASDLCGQRTADNITENTRGESVGNVGVPLIRPEKVRGMRKWRQIIVIDALDNPIKAKLVPYFKRKRWNAVADKNPYRK